MSGRSQTEKTRRGEAPRIDPWWRSVSPRRAWLSTMMCRRLSGDNTRRCTSGISGFLALAVSGDLFPRGGAPVSAAAPSPAHCVANQAPCHVACSLFSPVAELQMRITPIRTEDAGNAALEAVNDRPRHSEIAVLRHSCG